MANQRVSERSRTGGRPTLDEVAARAGVGRGTVSRVVNGSPQVSPSAKAAVEDAIDQIEIQVHELQGLITELRPAALDDLGLAPALETLYGRLRAAHGLDVMGTTELAYQAGLASSRLAPEIESMFASTPSRSPHSWSSWLAVLSPMPGTPGMLSEVSPFRPTKSGTSSGGMP